jgi:hypothetical protein
MNGPALPQADGVHYVFDPYTHEGEVLPQVVAGGRLPEGNVPPGKVPGGSVPASELPRGLSLVSLPD